MKVLLIDAPISETGGNWIGALLYAGLVDELGAEAVVDWPATDAYHKWQPHPYPWIHPRSERTWSDDEVASRIREFELVVLASPKDQTVAHFERLLGRVGRSAIPKLVLVDGEDYTQNRWDLVERFAPSVLFKVSTWPRPWPQFLEEKARVEHTVRVVPFAMATTILEPVAREKTIDVCLLGGNHWYGPRREGIAEDRPLQKPIFEQRLRDEFPDRALVTGNLPHAEFVDVLARSKISVVLGGHGIEAIRSYESMSSVDTLCVRWDSEHIAPVPLIHGEHCVTWRTIDECMSLVRYYLEHDHERLRIARAGNGLIRDHYTPRARARHLLSEAMR